ncbi:MAG: hypothetical protein ACLP1X_01645 [Polyangiaceae bacterium]
MAEIRDDLLAVDEFDFASFDLRNTAYEVFIPGAPPIVRGALPFELALQLLALGLVHLVEKLEHRSYSRGRHTRSLTRSRPVV